MRLIIIILLISGALFCAPQSIRCEGSPLRTVAYTGMQPPGAPADTFFQRFNSAVMNGTGDVAFVGTTSLPQAASLHTGIWSEGGSAGLRSVSYNGQIVSHLTGEDTLRAFGRLFINDHGQTAFEAFAGDSCRGCGIPMIIMEDISYNLNVVARIDWPAPMASDQARFRGFGLDDFNNQGEAVIEGELIAPFDRESGVWILTAEHNARLVAREGDQAPGLPPGTTIRSISNNTSQFVLPLTDSGQTSFIMNNHEAAWIGSSHSDLRKLFARGDPVPGIGSPGTFNQIGQPRLTDDGDAIFQAHFIGTGIGLNDDDAIFRGSHDTGFRVVAREGDQAVGFPAGVVFHQFGFKAANSAGETAFSAYVGGMVPNDQLVEGVWLHKSTGELSLIANKGMILPGTNEGETLRGILGVLINELGQVGFRARLLGPDVNDFNDTGFWLQGQDGNLHFIARIGQTIDVGHGSDVKQRTIRDFSGVSFNAKGQFAFQARFSDGTEGIFVSNLVAVPEPASWLLLLFSGITIIAERSRRRTIPGRGDGI